MTVFAAPYPAEPTFLLGVRLCHFLFCAAFYASGKSHGR